MKRKDKVMINVISVCFSDLDYLNHFEKSVGLNSVF